MVRTVRINPKETWIDRLAIKGIQSTESPFTRIGIGVAQLITGNRLIILKHITKMIS